jgi:hypothetical protein
LACGVDWLVALAYALYSAGFTMLGAPQLLPCPELWSEPCADARGQTIMAEHTPSSMTEAETSFFIQRSWEISCDCKPNVLTLLQHSLRGTRQFAPS